MAQAFDPPSIGGTYRQNEPSDDGSETAANEITWSKHVDKLAEPLKAYIDATVAETDSAFDSIFPAGITSASTNYTVQTTDNSKLISATNTITITLPAAATAGVGFLVWIVNNGTGVVTVDGDGAETINGESTIALAPGASLLITTTGASWSGVHVPESTFNQTLTMSGKPIELAEGAAVASAATTDIWANDDGNILHITGSTGPITSFGTAPQAGAIRILIFDSTPTLTDSANLNLNNGGSDITAAAGDIAVVIADTTTQMDVFFLRKTGYPVNLTNMPLTTPVINSATGIGQSIVARKTADESVSNSTTLQDDDHLTFAIAADEEWTANFYLDVGAVLSNTGIKIGVTVPTGATLNAIASFVGDVATETLADRTTTSGGTALAVPDTVTSGDGFIHVSIWVLNSSTAGSVTLQFAQENAVVTDLTVRKGSHMIAHRVA